MLCHDYFPLFSSSVTSRATRGQSASYPNNVTHDRYVPLFTSSVTSWATRGQAELVPLMLHSNRICIYVHCLEGCTFTASQHPKTLIFFFFRFNHTFLLPATPAIQTREISYGPPRLLYTHGGQPFFFLKYGHTHPLPLPGAALQTPSSLIKLLHDGVPTFYHGSYVSRANALWVLLD